MRDWCRNSSWCLLVLMTNIKLEILLKIFIFPIDLSALFDVNVGSQTRKLLISFKMCQYLTDFTNSVMPKRLVRICIRLHIKTNIRWKIKRNVTLLNHSVWKWVVLDFRIECVSINLVIVDSYLFPFDIRAKYFNRQRKKSGFLFLVFVRRVMSYCWRQNLDINFSMPAWLEDKNSPTLYSLSQSLSCLLVVFAGQKTQFPTVKVKVNTGFEVWDG